MNCRYVGSRALLLLANRKAETPFPDFDGLSTKLYENLQENEILHVCPQALKSFVNKVLPSIKTKFVLITNNSDWTVPDDVKLEFFEIVNNPYLIRWFAQNCIINHEKITRIPIGLDYHTLTPTPSKKQHIWSPPPKQEKHYWGPKIEPIEQEAQLLDLKNKSSPFWERQCKAYANFHFAMYTTYGKTDRVDAHNTISKDLIYYEPNYCLRLLTWTNMINYAFVISPHGNGLDCHRTWEALCLGCIPIVKTSGLDSLYAGLPVWIVNSWSEVTQENMAFKINEFKEKQFNYDKLTTDYWRKLIYSCRPN